MDALDRRLLDRLQDGMPICRRPLQAVAAQLGLGETQVVERIRALLADGVLTRYGPLFDAGAMGGALSLCAMAVAEDDVERVAASVNARPEVAHNYEREHEYNLWFVVATEAVDGVAGVLAGIEAETGYPVLDLPKQQEFFVGLRLELNP